MSATYTVKVKGVPVTFTSALSDLDALAALRVAVMPGGRYANSEFAHSLAESRYTLSPAQNAWVQKLMLPPAPPPANPVGDFSPLVKLFGVANAHLKYPKITLQAGDPTDPTVIVVKLAGPRSKYAGSVHVTNNAGYNVPGNKYYGHVTPDGTFHAGRALTPDVEAVLRDLNSDPVAAAKAYGRLTGRCCFCNASLSDERSVAEGYGPVCAKHYALPWGKGKVEFTAADDSAAYLAHG